MQTIGSLIVIGFRPSPDYREGIKLFTDIFTAQNGTERRLTCSSRTKRTLSYSAFQVTRQEVGAVEEMMTYAIKYNCYHPLWFSMSACAADGSNIVGCDTRWRDFVVGQYAIFWASNTNFAVSQISEISENSLTLANNITISNAIVMPLVKMTPAKNIRYQITNDSTAKSTFSFEELL